MQQNTKTKKQRTKLTPKQERFCKEYIINNGNGTRAAIKAGYKKNSAQGTASCILSKAIIKHRIKKLQSKTAKRLNITQDMVLDRLWKIADDETRRDQVRALELVGKYHSMFTDKLTVENKQDGVVSIGDVVEKMGMPLAEKKKLLAAIRELKAEKGGVVE